MNEWIKKKNIIIAISQRTTPASSLLGFKLLKWYQLKVKEIYVYHFLNFVCYFLQISYTNV